MGALTGDRARLASAVAAEKAFKSWSWERMQELEQGFRREVVDAAGRKAKRRKLEPPRELTVDDLVKAKKRLSDEEHAAILSKWQAVADGFYRGKRFRLAELVAEADAIAATLDARPGPLEVELSSCHASSYSSQGWGAMSYARGSCRIRAIDAEARGIETKLVETERLVRCLALVEDPVDVEIIRRAPKTTLKDQVFELFRLTLDPLVYNPFIPPEVRDRLWREWSEKYHASNR
jgi:hypothetical protein